MPYSRTFVVVSLGFTFIGKINITKCISSLSPPALEYLVRSNFNGLGGELETGVDSADPTLSNINLHLRCRLGASYKGIRLDCKSNVVM